MAFQVHYCPELNVYRLTDLDTGRQKVVAPSEVHPDLQPLFDEAKQNAQTK